jgi:predicted nuclease of predicted toxin-antitoxin system
VKLLLDHNLSPRLVRLLSDVYSEITHVHDLGMDTASDSEVWYYAAEHGYTILSKDADFHQRSLLFGAPPKVVWLRIGNCSVAESADALRERYIEIRRFIEASTADFLVLSSSSGT